MLQNSRLILVACLVVPTITAQAQQTATPEQAHDETGADARPNPDQRPRPASPAETFTPSEEIGADSAVSFPVDI